MMETLGITEPAVQDLITHIVQQKEAVAKTPTVPEGLDSDDDNDELD